MDSVRVDAVVLRDIVNRGAGLGALLNERVLKDFEYEHEGPLSAQSNGMDSFSLLTVVRTFSLAPKMPK